MSTEKRFIIKVKKAVRPYLETSFRWVTWFHMPLLDVWNNTPAQLCKTALGRHKLKMYLLSAGIKI